MYKYAVIVAIIITVSLLAFPAWSADYYIAQSAAGANNATSCANAKAVTWNWTSPNVVEGDTVHLCGTFTSTLTIPQSFASTVTVKFETGSKFSKAAWGTEGNAAIYAAGKNNITIDGNNTGIIENTDNGDSGSGKGTDQESDGIYISASSNWKIKNLTIQNIYIHTYDDPAYTRSTGISIVDGSDIQINNNILNNAYYGVMARTGSTNVEKIYVSNNTISACESGIVIALGANGTIMDTVNIYNNNITLGYNWFDTTNHNHMDGIHIWGRYARTSDTISNLKIYNNIIGGDPTIHTTGLIFMENTIISPQIYNNVLYVVNNHVTDGMICIGGTSGVATNGKIYQNTIVGDGAGMGIRFVASSGNDVKNNIVYSFAYGLIEGDTNSTISQSDHNVFYGITQERGWLRSGVAKSWAEWKALALDFNSSISEPSFVNAKGHDYRLQSSDTIALDQGTTLGSSWASDINGVKRPQGAAWDIGAYEYTYEGAKQKFTGNIMIGGAGLFN